MSVLVVVLLAAQAAPAQEPVRDEWLPLAAGNQWTYRSDYDDVTEFVHEVVGTEKVGAVECFVVEHRSLNPSYEGSRIMRKEWLAKDGEGTLIHRLQRGRSLMEVDKPFFKLKRELRKNDEWEGEARIAENPPRFHAWVEDEVDVEVPAGKFRAQRLRTRVEAGPKYTAEGFEWYARGTGLVKAEMTLRIGGEGTSFTTELKKFRPGGKEKAPERR